MALALGIAITLIARRRGYLPGRTAMFTIVVLASHGLLDTMTDGGLGCALLWPFSLTRFFAPWRPIPVAPIGLDYLSLYGAIVAASELALFSPLFVYALRPRRLALRPLIATSFVTVWLVALWLIASGDRIRESILSVVLRENVSFPSGFSEAAFQSLAPGMSDQAVRGLLGVPHGESWYYPPRDQPTLRAEDASVDTVRNECLGVGFEYGFSMFAADPDTCERLGIWNGTSIDDVQRILGVPRQACWEYSWSPTGRYHRLRMVCFLDSRVDLVFSRWVHGG
jgi:hypothetical protein